MPNAYRLQVRKTKAAKEAEIDHLAGRDLWHVVKQPWYPRIVAGNGKIVFTGETMHNRSDAAAALAKLVMAVQSGEFKYEFPDG